MTYPPLAQPINAGIRFSDRREMQTLGEVVGLIRYWGGTHMQRQVTHV